ncbi:MAG: sigma-70 family RNA polymerase sigma factor [Dehalococcoidia bacterium]
MTTHEDELILHSKDGNLAAYNRLVEIYQQQVYNIALRMLGSPQDAEDITQEIFVQAWKSLHGFRGKNFRAWLFRISSNACKDFLRSKKSRKADSLDAIFPEYNPLPSSAESPEDHALKKEVAELIASQLLYLSEEQRLVVTLADLQGLSYEEIAEITSTSLGTVKSRLNRGRANLRDLLLKHQELLPLEFRP